MQLPQSKESEDSDDPGMKLVHTSDSEDECNLGGSGHMDLAGCLGIPSGGDFSLLGLGIVGFILLNSLEEFLPFDLVVGSPFLTLLFKSGCKFLISFFLFLLSLGLRGDFLFGLHLPQSTNNNK